MLHENYKNHLQHYTDGSTAAGGRTGAGTFPGKAVHAPFQTSRSTASTIVDLEALRTALCMIEGEPPQKLVTFTESKTTL